jgi:hypothetical protein
MTRKIETWLLQEEEKIAKHLDESGVILEA